MLSYGEIKSLELHLPPAICKKKSVIRFLLINNYMIWNALVSHEPCPCLLVG